MGYTKGQKISLKSATAYASSSTNKSSGTKTGTFYIWSAATTNGRIRITTKQSYAGKTPASKYVTCWIKTSAIQTQKATVAQTTQIKSATVKSANVNAAVKAAAESADSKQNTTTIINIAEKSDVTPTGSQKGQLGYLGKVLFIVSDEKIQTITGFSMQESARYVEHDRHLKRPTVEFTGIEAQKISFTMELSKYLNADPWAAYNTLLGYMNSGTAVPMKIGTKQYGTYRWCIQDLKFAGKRTDGKGNWIAADVTVSIIGVEKKG